MTDATIHLHERDALNSKAACGKVFMSARAQERLMTFSVHNATCKACLDAIPAKFR